jgi:hypothetical protein
MRSRSQPGVAEPPGADDDPYVLYLRWVEAGRPSSDDAEPAAGATTNGSPDDLADEDWAADDGADDAVVVPAATPSTGHLNAVDAPTGAMASIRRRFRLFGRR